MHPKPGHLLAGSLLCVTVLLAAGCGGGSTPSTTTTTTTAATTTTTAMTTTAATTTAAAATTSTMTGTTSTSASGTTGTSTTAAGSLTNASNCADLTNLSSAFSEAFSGTAGKTLQQRLALFQQFASQTPASIRPDFEIIAADYAKIVSALGGATSSGTPSASEIASLASLQGSLNEQQLGQAEAAIGQWAATNCTGG